MTFADRIMSHKYAHTKTDGTKETWDEIAKRVARNVMKSVNSPKPLTKEVERIIREKKFVPGGRYLYAAGRPYHQTQNCFDGSTAFVTRKGISTLEQSCGKTVEVLNKNGAWESAEVRAFDEQEIIKLRLSNGVEINTTEGHLWIQPDGSRVSTVEAEQVMLSPGNTEVALDSDGIRHGVIFGDGHMVKNRYSQIVLCGEKKQELADLFLNETREIVVGFGAVIKVQTVRDSKRGKVVSLQPRHYKELPVDPTPSYARGFIAGLVATDGCVPSGGSITISCEGLELANSIGQIAVLGGCVVNSVRVTSKISPFDGTPRELSVVSLKPFSVPIIRTDQKQTLSRRKLRRCLSATVDVEAIEYTGRYEPVYCVVAPQTQTFTLACGILTSNCLLLRAEDSREGWAELMHKSCKALMTGAGIGIDYSEIRAKGKAIRKTGGQATGPCALMEMVNCAGRGIMQGGSRRSAIWAGLNWKHPDIHEFITSKNWISEVRALKLKDFNFPATMDGTNISVQLDDEFFKAYGDEAHHQHALAYGTYWTTVRQMLKTGEPGFSIDTGVNKNETLRNAPVSANTRVLTLGGYKSVGAIIGIPTRLWTGLQWSPPVEFKRTGVGVEVVEVELSNGRSIVCDPNHPFLRKNYLGAGIRKQVEQERVAAGSLLPGDKICSDLPYTFGEVFDATGYAYGFVFGDGYIRDGRGEISYWTDSKKDCWECAVKTLEAHTVSKDNRAYFKCDFTNKYELLTRINASFVAGYFDADGSYTRGLLRLGSHDRNILLIVQEYLDSVGIKSVVREDGFSGYKPDSRCYTLLVPASSISRFAEIIPTKRLKIEARVPYRQSEIRVVSVKLLEHREDVYCVDVEVEEHAFMAEGVLVSNCTEVTSEDDSDICNLGSINLARISDIDDFNQVLELGTAFLLAGTVYSDVPYPQVDQVRTKNRRLGLGLMGIHEWLLKRGKKYGPDTELEKYLHEYTKSTSVAKTYADKWDLSAPVKTRAIAPTGTISIISGTTSGIEPLFCAAYKRRYLKGSTWQFEYVIDPIAKQLVDSGMDPDQIEDAYSIRPDRRIDMQAWLQLYVDHAISSTCNIPAWGTESNNESTVQQFGAMLIKYLPKLRGLTVYPDASRGGQPLSVVKYATAVKHSGEVFEESGDVCEFTKGGSCGA